MNNFMTNSPAGAAGSMTNGTNTS